MLPKPSHHGEQMDLFRPILERPTWGQIPAQERTEIVRLLAELLLQRTQKKDPVVKKEVSHE